MAGLLYGGSRWQLFNLEAQSADGRGQHMGQLAKDEDVAHDANVFISASHISACGAQGMDANVLSGPPSELLDDHSYFRMEALAAAELVDEQELHCGQISQREKEAAGPLGATISAWGSCNANEAEPQAVRVFRHYKLGASASASTRQLGPSALAISVLVLRGLKATAY